MGGIARNLHLDVIICREDAVWVAHCLQLDLVTTASTAEEAFRDMKDVLAAHIQFADENDNWEHLFRPAPAEAWNRMFELERRGIKPIVEVVDLKPPSQKFLTHDRFEIQSLSYAFS